MVIHSYTHQYYRSIQFRENLGGSRLGRYGGRWRRQVQGEMPKSPEGLQLGKSSQVWRVHHHYNIMRNCGLQTGGTKTNGFCNSSSFYPHNLRSNFLWILQLAKHHHFLGVKQVQPRWGKTSSSLCPTSDSEMSLVSIVMGGTPMVWDGL